MNVASITVTITDKTQPGRTVLDLLQNGSGSGYTVVGTVQGNVGWTNVGYRGIQALTGNTGSIYVGDAGTANDGSQQGRVLAKGDLFERDDYGSPISLGVYVRCNTNDDKFNVMVEGS